MKTRLKANTEDEVMDTGRYIAWRKTAPAWPPAMRSLAVLLLFTFAMAACSSDDSQPELAPVQAQTFDNAAPETGSAQIQGGDEAEAVESEDADGGEIAAEVGAILDETGETLSGAELEEYLARRYEAYWHAFDIARRSPTADAAADYPTLFNLAAGEQLDSAYRELAELFTNGQAIREPDSPAIDGLDQNTALRIRIESLEEGVAELVSCLVNDQVTYDVADGSIISESVRTVQARATMARANGTWKLIRSQATGLEAGVGGCWLDDQSEYPY